jgi:hypothetical protein
MRKLRALTIAAAVIATLPTLAAAQADREFKDAWFWGVKVGGFSLADSGGRVVQAPSVGVDWLITRTHGGVYMAASEAFFSQHTHILQDPFHADSGFRSVSIKNFRRFDVMAMGFPGEFKHWRPYGGAGFTFGEVATTHAEGVFSTVDQLTFAQQVIQNNKASFTPIFMGGAQYRLHYFSIFGQLALSPTQQTSLLFNGKSSNFIYEVGFRYNIGSSIERDY